MSESRYRYSDPQFGKISGVAVPESDEAPLRGHREILPAARRIRKGFTARLNRLLQEMDALAAIAVENGDAERAGRIRERALRIREIATYLVWSMPEAQFWITAQKKANADPAGVCDIVERWLEAANADANLYPNGVSRPERHHASAIAWFADAESREA